MLIIPKGGGFGGKKGITLASSNVTSTNVDSLDLTLSFAAAQNDVVLAMGAWKSGGSAVALNTAGYTATGTRSTNVRLGAFWKRMTASPDSSVSLNNLGSGGGAVFMVYVFRGVNVTTAVDATATGATGTSTTPDSPSITTVTANAAIISFVGSFVNDGAVTLPTGYSNQLSANNSDGADPQTSGAAWTIGGAAGAINPPSWTAFTSGDWEALSIALKPA